MFKILQKFLPEIINLLLTFYLQAVYPMYKPYNHLLQLRWHDGFFQIVYTHIQFKNFLSSFLILLSIAKLIHT